MDKKTAWTKITAAVSMSVEKFLDIFLSHAFAPWFYRLSTTPSAFTNLTLKPSCGLIKEIDYP
jgi:hypothetical protein